MPFKCTHTHPDQIVFTRLNPGCGRALLFLLGSSFLIVGIALLYFSKTSEMPLVMLKYLFPGFGLLAIYIGIIFPTLQAKSTPDTITFDNKKGRVQIDQKNSEVKTAYIYYDEIKGFSLSARHTRGTSHVNNTPDTYDYDMNHTYQIYLDKKDGGQWQLLEMNSQKDAVLEIEKLNSIINFSIKPERIKTSLFPSEKYSISKDFNNVKLTWRNKTGAAMTFLGVFAIVFIITFCSVFLNMFPNGSGTPVFVYIIGGFIALLFLFIITILSRRIIKNAKTIYSLIISKSTFSYLEKDHSEKTLKEVNIPLSELHAISFTFTTDNTMRKIFIYTHEQFLQKDLIKTTFSIESIKEIYNFYMGLLTLNINALTAIEALYLENYLQEQIKEMGQIELA